MKENIIEMLSDEEKQAIEYLKRHIIPCYGRKGTIKFMLNDTLLNLIEKQSEEIEVLKNKKPTFLIKDLYNPKLKEVKLQDVEGLIEQGREEIKAKIKAKIEELEKLDFGTDLVSQFTANLTTITILQSLLEKE